jgi:hypothetical protein
MNAIPDQSTPYPLAIGSRHLTLLNDVRTILIASGLPHSYWAEAVCYAACVRKDLIHSLYHGCLS